MLEDMNVYELLCQREIAVKFNDTITLMKVDKLLRQSGDPQVCQMIGLECVELGRKHDANPSVVRCETIG